MYIWRKSAAADWLATHSEGLFERFGSAVAVIERPGKTRAAVEISCPTKKEAFQLQREFGGTIEKLRADWLQQLAKGDRAKPLRIGSRLIVSRTRAQNENRARTIVIPAEAAFGTGEHATTAMCLRMLERVTRKWNADWSMLDAGTGSGILAIAASRFGANPITGIDNDPMAIRIASRNAAANRVRHIEFRTGDVLQQKLRAKFDLITANLFSDILVAVLPKWRRSLAADGRLIVSGVLRSQERSLATALRRSHFTVLETRRRGKWSALLVAQTRKNS